jgi:PAS domain S-box-containing protein
MDSLSHKFTSSSEQPLHAETIKGNASGELTDTVESRVHDTARNSSTDNFSMPTGTEYVGSESESPIQILHSFSQSTTSEFLLGIITSWFCGVIVTYLLYQFFALQKGWYSKEMIASCCMLCLLIACIIYIARKKTIEYQKLYGNIRQFADEYNAKSILQHKMEHEFHVKSIEMQSLSAEFEKQTHKLRERENWLELALKANNGSLWEWDLIRHRISVSEDWLKLLGYENNEFEIDLNRWLELIFVEDREYAKSTLENFLTEPYSGKIFENTYRVICKNASVRWIKNRGVMQCDDDGNVIRIVGTNHDVHERYTAESRVQAQQERFYNLLNSITDVYCELDKTGKIINISPSVEEHTGHPISYFVGNNIFDLLDKQTARQLKHQLMKYGKAEDFPITILDVKGDVVYAKANISTVVLSSGSTMVIGIIRNNTAHVLAQRESEYNARLLTEAQRIAKLGSFELNATTGEFSLSNQLIQILGITESVVSPPFLDIIIPDDRYRVHQQWDECIKNNSATFTSDFRVYHAQGSIIFVRCIADIEYEPHTHKPTNIVGALQDVTELKLSLEQQLQLTSIIEATPNVVAMINLEGCITYMNKQGMQQICDDDTIIGSKFTTLFPDDVKDIVINEYIPHAIEHGMWQGETTWLHTDGSRIPMQQILIAHRSSSGYLSYLSTIAVDIRDNKKAQEAMLEAKLSAESACRAKSAFLSSISHELRTPLNSILGFAQILARDEAIPQLQRKHIDVMYRSGEHLLEMINDVLDISKIEANHLELHANEFDLHTVVRDVGDMLNIRATEKGLKLIRDVDTAIPRVVVGDAMRLRQVLINLLSNAIKFTVQGNVQLRVVSIPNPNNSKNTIAMRFDVVDTGRGIPRDQLNDIFQPFRQVRGSYSEGTGLGLAISSRIVSLMGSSLEVESTVGIGTRFYFTTVMNLPAEANITGMQKNLRGSHFESISIYKGDTDEMSNCTNTSEKRNRVMEDNDRESCTNTPYLIQSVLAKPQLPTPTLSEIANVIQTLPDGERKRLIEAIDLQMTDDITSIIRELYSDEIIRITMPDEFHTTLQYINDAASTHSLKVLTDIYDALGG